MQGRAVPTWGIALMMWPNASLRNYGKHEVVTVNTSHQLLRVESDHIQGRRSVSREERSITT